MFGDKDARLLRACVMINNRFCLWKACSIITIISNCLCGRPQVLGKFFVLYLHHYLIKVGFFFSIHLESPYSDIVLVNHLSFHLEFLVSIWLGPRGS